MNEITQTQFLGDFSRLQSRVDILDRLKPEFYAQEVERIFRRAWLPVASVTDLPSENCYVVADVPPLNASLVVARGDDGKVRAFYNVCRHRGARLVKHQSGCRKALSCGFHGWTYATDGRLIGVTDKTQFADLDPEQLGLVAVNCEVWEDYVFVNFDPKPRATLRQWLGKFHDQYEGFFSNRQRIASYRIVVDANWNVAINSFSEGYHAAYVHRKTVPDYQGGQQNPQRHRAYLEITEHHGRYSAQANPNRRITPVEKIAYDDGRPLYPSFPPFSETALPLPPGVNASRNENWGFDVAEVFPVLIWIIGAHWHANLWFWPVSPDKTDVRVEFFAYKAETVGDCLAHAYFRTRLREVFREDVGTMEQVTSALKSGAMQGIVLSRQELLLQQHYAVADEMLGEAVMSGPRSLPQQFSALAPFVEQWALPTEAERLAKLSRTPIGELKAFYDAMFARAEEMKRYLADFKLDAMPDDAATLLDLLLTFIETAHPIELSWSTTDIDDAFPLDRMTIGHFNVYPPREKRS